MKGKGIENTTQFKMPRVNGMGVFQVKNGFKTFKVTIAMHSYCLFSNNLHIHWGCWFQTDKRIEVERKSGNHN